MFTPTFKAAVWAGALLLAGCQQQPSLPQSDAANAMSAAAVARSPVQEIRDWIEGRGDTRERIYCALGATAPVTQECRMEITKGTRDRSLILSRPDGSFRRLRIAADGKLSAADGAVEARIAGTDRAIGVVFGDERYSVPRAALASAVPR